MNAYFRTSLGSVLGVRSRCQRASFKHIPRALGSHDTMFRDRMGCESQRPQDQGHPIRHEHGRCVLRRGVLADPIEARPSPGVFPARSNPVGGGSDTSCGEGGPHPLCRGTVVAQRHHQVQIGNRRIDGLNKWMPEV